MTSTDPYAHFCSGLSRSEDVRFFEGVWLGLYLRYFVVHFQHSER